jgi:hypothetical protein
VNYTVASYDSATGKYTLSSIEKVGQKQLEGVLQKNADKSAKTLAENAETLTPKSNYGKKVLYKEVEYTVTSFDEKTGIYTIRSVRKAEKHELDGEKPERPTSVGGQGKRSSTLKAA